MSFSARTKTTWGSFWLGTALNVFTIILANIINSIASTPIFALNLSLIIIIGLVIYLLNIKIFHPIYFWVGVFFGFVLVTIVAVVLLILGLTTIFLLFGVH